jgi:hypothetical protein
MMAHLSHFAGKAHPPASTRRHPSLLTFRAASLGDNQTQSNPIKLNQTQSNSITRPPRADAGHPPVKTAARLDIGQ